MRRLWRRWLLQRRLPACRKEAAKSSQAKPSQGETKEGRGEGVELGGGGSLRERGAGMCRGHVQVGAGHGDCAHGTAAHGGAWACAWGVVHMVHMRAMGICMGGMACTWGGWARAWHGGQLHGASCLRCKRGWERPWPPHPPPTPLLLLLAALRPLATLLVLFFHVLGACASQVKLRHVKSNQGSSSQPTQFNSQVLGAPTGQMMSRRRAQG